LPPAKWPTSISPHGPSSFWTAATTASTALRWWRCDYAY
jgi:hypothetical protein